MTRRPFIRKSATAACLVLAGLGVAVLAGLGAASAVDGADRYEYERRVQTIDNTYETTRSFHISHVAERDQGSDVLGRHMIPLSSRMTADQDDDSGSCRLIRQTVRGDGTSTMQPDADACTPENHDTN